MAQAPTYKLIWLQIMVVPSKKSHSLCIGEDLASFGYFQRSSVREHLVFASRTSSERCPKGSRVTISLKEVPYKLHVWRRVDGLVAIAITDNHYPERVAQSLNSKMLTLFEKKHGNAWKKVCKDQAFQFNQIYELLKDYKAPDEADKLMAVQQNLDQIKGIMHKNIEDILERGETLDNLLQRSDDIGMTAKMFHSKAKKNNQCCQMY